MGTQLQIVEVCLEAIRWPPRSRSESPHRLVKILGLASQVFGPTQFSHLTFFFSHEADRTLHGHLGQKGQR